MRLKLVFRDVNITRFINFLKIMARNSLIGVNGVMMTISYDKIIACYDYKELSEYQVIFDFTSEIKHFIYSYFEYIFNVRESDIKAQTIDEIQIENKRDDPQENDVMTVRMSIEDIKTIIELTTQTTIKSLSLRLTKNTNKDESFKNVLEVIVVLTESIEISRQFAIKTRKGPLPIKETDYGNNQIHFNHTLDNIKVIAQKSMKRKYFAMIFLRNEDNEMLIFKANANHFRSIIFPRNTVKFVDKEEDEEIEKRYLINSESVSQIFKYYDNYNENQQFIISDEYLTVMLTISKMTDDPDYKITYSKAIMTMEITEIDDDELAEQMNPNN